MMKYSIQCLSQIVTITYINTKYHNVGYDLYKILILLFLVSKNCLFAICVSKQETIVLATPLILGKRVILDLHCACIKPIALNASNTIGQNLSTVVFFYLFLKKTR